MIQSPTARLPTKPGSTPMLTHRLFWGPSFSVSAFRTRHWHRVAQQSLRLGSWRFRCLWLRAWAFGTTVRSLVGDNAVVAEWTDELVALATEQGFPVRHGQGTLFRGWVRVTNGDVIEGISLLRGGSAAYRDAGSEVWMTYYVALLARACETAGQIEEAVTLLDDGLRIVERTGERWLEADLYRHKGELLLRQGQAETAENLYRKALSIAREQEAKLWELRATVSLARLRRDQGRCAQARDLLAPVYGWFTEGFDTPDLKDAKTLLDELG